MEKNCDLYQKQTIILECGDVDIMPLSWRELNLALNQTVMLNSKERDEAEAAQETIAELMASHVQKDNPGEFINSLTLTDYKTLFESLLEISSIKKDEEKN